MPRCCCAPLSCSPDVLKIGQLCGNWCFVTKEEYDALISLISSEQMILIDDEENEFWNTIRRKLRHLTYQSAL